MPSTALRMYEDQLPSFMSVFDVNAIAMDGQGGVTVNEQKLMELEAHKLPPNGVTQLRPTTLQDVVHKHHDSTSTQNSESAGSSPTTTASCTDSSSLSDPSPSSSPDSPVNLLPLSLSSSSTSFGGLSSMASLNVCDVKSLERPTTSPAPRRAKNMKGLSIQPPFSSISNPSEPASPCFIKPVIPGMKRKPSQLSLKTNTTGLATRNIEVPSSPSVAPILQAPILQRRALKHSSSSPHMLSSLKSATFGPAGGMTIPTVLERNETGLSEFFRPSKPPPPPATLKSPITEEDSPIRPQMANRAVFDFEDYHEIENGEDQKTPGYPDGPIAIYNDNVYLYLEPSAEEAAKFDVVINVAREVRNPFEGLALTQPPVSDAESRGDSPIPDTALTGMSYATAFEFFPEEDSPATPRATTFKQPEYIHIPWDHHTDIGKDLMNLCEMIEKKTKEGKKVLIHCQQGASRSASLIIAYGMWQNPDLSVNDAYHAAQAKSRWISPNMRLMYCLQDFQKEVAKRKLASSSGLNVRAGRSPSNKHRMTLSVDAIDISPAQPLTAPLPGEDGSSNGTRSPDDRSPGRARGNSTPNRGEPISPGPSSAPSSFSWAEKEDEKVAGKLGRFNFDVVPAPSQPSSGFASLDSMTAPEPPTRLAPPPPAFSRALPSPGFGSFAEPPSSPGFGSFPRETAPAPFPNFSHPLSSGFPRFGSSYGPPSKPPPSPGFNQPSFSKAPPSLRLGDDSFSKPPPSPGLTNTSFSKPPPSPGFGSHRFNGKRHKGFGLVPLNLSPPRHGDATQEHAPERQIRVMKSFDDAGLLSPRLETMTNNPLRDPFNKVAGLHFVEVPPTPSEGLFSPREALFPRDPFFPFGQQTVKEDPRSPPIQGEAPIVRSIDEII
ncbi:Tyrosine-protein phosphatase pmp1 [Coniochaeta hoffmannii]|uniref:protein-tyrosine-phosphatase n=1 Tax=Coniochaeta hoffmannii TaxID=91930 RepID=A0AA38VBP2_9PEZI|nr:Tyrosine-protein phosphatase pmp1 [Coniochaeta hoffmannii]